MGEKRRFQGCLDWGEVCPGGAGGGPRSSRTFSVPGEGCIFCFLWLVLSWQWEQKLEVSIIYQAEVGFEPIVKGVFVGLPELICYCWWADFLQV